MALGENASAMRQLDVIVWLIINAQEGPTLRFSKFIRVQKARQAWKLS